MSPRAGMPMDPKTIRLELRLSERSQEMLEYCVAAYKVSKGEIVRRGIEAIYKQADRAKKVREEIADWETVIYKAEQDRIEEIKKETYGQAFHEAYAEKFAELIRDPQYTCRRDVEHDAAEYAKDIAKAMADDAVNKFLGLNSLVESMKKKSEL